MQNFYFIGIGGSGMSAIAALLHEQGKVVRGSDMQQNAFVEALQQKGIAVNIGHDANNLTPDTEAVIYSSAIPENNPERQIATQYGIRQFSYSEAVGELLTKQHNTIAICGTHGKTTTTSMAAIAFIAAEKDPSVIVGAQVPELLHANYRLGGGEWFIVEACEYQRSFLHYRPKVIIITNIEVDHLDYYQDRDDYLQAFVQFLQRLPSDGLIVANADDSSVVEVIKKYQETHPDRRIVWYGAQNNAEYVFKKSDESIQIYYKTEMLGTLQLAIPGEHNVMNALAVLALCHTLKFTLQPVIKALEGFKGAERRFQLVGYVSALQCEVPIIDDYGHHPTEIAVTLKAARDKFGSEAKILCIFQPHQHSRTQALLEDFRRCFNYADTVIIPNIYAARDTAAMKEAMSAKKFVEELSKVHPDVRHGEGLEATANKAKMLAQQFDVIITMGAGDVGKVAGMLIS